MPSFDFTPEQAKKDVLNEVESYIESVGLTIADQDTEKPWGAYYVIDQASIDRFIELYFAELPYEEIFEYGKDIRPKILVVAPNAPLSWQYHDRRAELWKVVYGPIGVVQSETDEQGETERKNEGELITHGAGARHRLVGLSNWGVVAEIWQHTNPDHLSEEDDIVRLEDSYGRS